MVSGMMTPSGATNYTYPSELNEEIVQAVGEYRGDPYVKSGRSKDHLQEIRYWMERKEEICQYLLHNHEWDFFMNVVRAPDLVQHWFYDALDPGHPQYDQEAARSYGPLLESIYEACDQVIGNRLEMLHANTILLIVSDHGAGPVSQWFAVNRFLMDIGLMKAKPTTGLRRVIADKLDLSVLARLDLLGLRYRLSNSWALAAGQFLDRAFSPGSIDWSQAKAYSCSPDGLSMRVNLMGREPHGMVQPGEEYEQIRDRLRSELEGLQDPTTGLGVVSKVYLREEIFSGPHVEEAPDMIFSIGEGPFVPRPWLSSRRIFEPIWSKGWTGDHREQGIFVAAGSNLRPGVNLSAHSILDIAPTVLWAMGLPIPSDMDGAVTEDAFGEGFLKANPVRFDEAAGVLSQDRQSEYSREEEQEILERLRKLGYL
jgi:predicted AlkP superfamily phosphohydrolase/phosphomutase